jgi:signal transduction histidine kinase
MNLLLNARDATLALDGQPRRVSVQSGLADNGQAIEVRIADNGGGISPDHLKRIFDPMFTTKPRGKGTGLGLYICRQVVADHGGRIEVSSTPGDGTLIVVRLPAYAGKDGENGLHPRRG